MTADLPLKLTIPQQDQKFLLHSILRPTQKIVCIIQSLINIQTGLILHGIHSDFIFPDLTNYLIKYLLGFFLCDFPRTLVKYTQ